MDLLIAIPVYNEEKILEKSISKLHNYFSKNFRENWIIVIADNASTDRTSEIAENLAKKYSKVKAVHLKFKGRGNALSYVWAKNKSKIYAYCDVDLSTDISYFKELINFINNGYDIVTGSRYIKGSKANRALIRNILGKGYIYLVKLFFNTKLHDFQCGFKAINSKIAKEMIPKIRDKEWFFDTELLLLAEYNRYKIKEIPIKWDESKDSKVEIVNTAIDYITKLINLRRRLK